MASESDDDLTFNPRRRLCPDGSCVGIIGDNGKCMVCGASDAGAGPSTDPTELAGEAADEPEVEANEAGPEDGASGFDPNRRLCGDEACIGVLGEDNRCPVCGKPAAP
jgi:hypothetical protein